MTAISDEAVEAAAAKLPPVWTSSPVYRANLIQALEAAAPHLARVGVLPKAPFPDLDVEELVDLMVEADRTVDSPTVFTRWHHYAEFILSAGYRKAGA